MKLRTLGLLATLVASGAHAVPVGTAVTRVASVISYNQYGSGDVVLKVENPVTECLDGYWFTKTDPGYQANLGMAVVSSQVKTPVVVYGLPEHPWSGSSSQYCKLYSIELR